jgi:hypothetical protein
MNAPIVALVSLSAGILYPGGEPLQRKARSIRPPALDQLSPSDVKLVEPKDDTVRAILFCRVKAEDFLDGGELFVISIR